MSMMVNWWADNAKQYSTTWKENIVFHFELLPASNVQRRINCSQVWFVSVLIDFLIGWWTGCCSIDSLKDPFDHLRKNKAYWVLSWNSDRNRMWSVGPKSRYEWNNPFTGSTQCYMDQLIVKRYGISVPIIIKTPLWCSYLLITMNHGYLLICTKTLQSVY